MKFCLAVGFFTTNDSDNTQTVAEMWDGAAWHLIASPQRNAETTFNAVSCTSPTHCLAVGAFITQKPSTDKFTEFNIAALWNGKTWQVTRLPGKVGNPFGDDLGNLGLGSVSCATASNCMAVGNFGARPGPIVRRHRRSLEWHQVAADQAPRHRQQPQRCVVPGRQRLHRCWPVR